MPPFLSISEAANFLGVCTKTLRRWDRVSRLAPDFRTLGGHRRYDLMNLREFRTMPESSPIFSPVAHISPRVVVYARVSSHLQKQRGDLQRQIEELEQFAHQHHYQLVRTIQDVGSGLNDARKGLHQLIRIVSRGGCEQVLVAYPDRLARFGINVLKTSFAEWGVTLQIVHSPSPDAPVERRLIDDMTRRRTAAGNPSRPRLLPLSSGKRRTPP
jgi:putative resolvase